MGYFPDMSSQAAAQGYFEELVQRAISSSPSVQRLTGSPLFVDIGTSFLPASGSVVITPNLGNRGILGVFAMWNANGPMASSLRVTIAGSNFTLFNDNAGSGANAFWLAFAA